MNEHQVDGRMDEAKGKVKEVTGKVVGNDRLRGEGLADQAGGKTEAAYGDAKEKLKDSIKDAADKL